MGLPLFLAESARYLTRVVPEVVAQPIGPEPPAGDEGRLVLSGVAPEGRASVRVRILDRASGETLEAVERTAADDRELGDVLSTLPSDLTSRLRSVGVSAMWDPRFAPPPPPLSVALVRGQHACLQLSRPATHEANRDADREALRRERIGSMLRPLAGAATRSNDIFPAVLFFGALLGAVSGGAPVLQEYRLPANARCMEATDDRDPIFRLSALVLRVIGDAGVAQQRVRRLSSVPDPDLQRWLAALETIR
jgi:hypothetical protein